MKEDGVIAPMHVHKELEMDGVNVSPSATEERMAGDGLKVKADMEVA